MPQRRRRSHRVGRIRDRRCVTRPLSSACVGMHPADVWVTRLEANLSRAALGTDLTLEAGPQETLEPWHIAALSANSPCPPPAASSPSPTYASDNDDGDWIGCGCSTPGRRATIALPGTLTAALLLSATRRARRRRPARR